MKLREGSLLQSRWQGQAPRRGFFGEEAHRLQRLSVLREDGPLGTGVPKSKKEKKAQAHLAKADDEDEATILMATFCALHDVEAMEREEATTVEGSSKTLKTVNLDKPRAQVHLGRMGIDQEQRWYLDSGASNHMTGSKESFSELDGDVTGTVKFGDSSRVAIQGRGTIIFRCQNGEHRTLTDVYYVSQLCSSIISIGQLDECSSEVLIKDGVLRIRDREQ